MKKTFIILAITLTLTTLASRPVLANDIVLNFPFGGISQYEYFHELLITSLAESGHTVKINRVQDFPHLRIRNMLLHGEISISWLIRSEQRDKTYLPVPVPLTNGLIGKRILLIPIGRAHEYENVQTLNDFRRLRKIGGFGTNWYDTHVWTLNNLPYKEVANPTLIYQMVAAKNRGIDYFSRGFNEVIGEQADHPELEIEPNLMFTYERDFIFYVTPTRPDLVPILTDALNKARHSGLMERLIHKHWADNFERLQPETRTIIKLKTPE